MAATSDCLVVYWQVDASTPAASASISWDVTVGSTSTSPLSVPVGDGRAVLDRSQIGASLPTYLTIRITNQHGSDELVASVLLGDRIVDPYLAALAQSSAVATVQLGWDAIAASNRIEMKYVLTSKS